MIKKPVSIKILCIAFFVTAAHFAMGSFSGVDDKNKNKFSLKNISLFSSSRTLNPLHISSFQFIDTQDLFSKTNNNSVEVNSMVRLQNGNTTYVYPYKYVVKMPKFKTPAPPPHL